MGTGHADFYPHQFKPVLKLVASTSGRILIADEVGLGKTIEAIYVWKELQARHGSRRLLVVCPSMLQQKLQAELRNRFSIEASVVNAKELLEHLERAVDDTATAFTLIGSIESLRTRRPNSQDGERPRNARTPPSEDSKPPSKSTTTFLPEKGDRPGNGSIGSGMAGVAS